MYIVYMYICFCASECVRRACHAGVNVLTCVFSCSGCAQSQSKTLSRYSRKAHRLSSRTRHFGKMRGWWSLETGQVHEGAQVSSVPGVCVRGSLRVLTCVCFVFRAVRLLSTWNTSVIDDHSIDKEVRDNLHTATTVGKKPLDPSLESPRWPPSLDHWLPEPTRDPTQHLHTRDVSNGFVENP